MRTVGEAREFSVEHGIVGFDGVLRAFQTYVRRHRSQLVRAEVDAISDDKGLPPEVEAARQALIRRGELREGRKRWWQRGGDPQMAIELDLREDDDFELFETFGAHSIHANGFGFRSGEEVCMVYVHDSGTILSVLLENHVVDDFAREAELPAGALVDLETVSAAGQPKR